MINYITLCQNRFTEDYEYIHNRRSYFSALYAKFLTEICQLSVRSLDGVFIVGHTRAMHDRGQHWTPSKPLRRFRRAVSEFAPYCYRAVVLAVYNNYTVTQIYI